MTGCVLSYLYYKKSFKMIGIDLSKQQAIVANPKAM